MKKKVFIYFLSVSFLLTAMGFHGLIEAKGRVIGEMVSRGGVKYELFGRWRPVESFSVPVVVGMQIMTEEGGGARLVFSDGMRFEVSPSALVRVEEEGRISLSRGGIEFRVPSSCSLLIRAGRFTIMGSGVLQASRSLSGVPSDAYLLGSVVIYSDGMLVVKSTSGSLKVLGEDRRVVASLSSGDLVSLLFGKGSGGAVVAQLGEVGPVREAKEVSKEPKLFGLSSWAWGGIIMSAAVLGAVIAVASQEDHERRPICP